MATRNETDTLVDLNAADADELTRIEGIDSARARLILEHRQKHGPFKSWSDFQSVLGIGEALTEKAKRMAVLGHGEAAGAMEQPGMEAGVDALGVLTSLVRMDWEAAIAYEVAAQSARLPELREQLHQFREDHLRHVEALNPLIRELEGRPIERPKRIEELLLPSMVRLAAPFGDVALVLALIGHEQLTNLSYQVAREFDWDEDTERVLARNASDEERHLEWLSNTEDAFAEEQEQLEPQA